MGLMIWVSCPNCPKHFIGFGRHARQKLYVSMFTHIRLRHWDYYQMLGRQTWEDLKGLVD